MLATLTMFQAVAMFVEGGILVMETQMRNKVFMGRIKLTSPHKPFAFQGYQKDTN